ncbi:GtrA family protein [Streptomyces caeruleatus]
MSSPLVQKAETATPAAPDPVAAFLRFLILGGGVGVLSGLVVPLLATLLPWAVGNALVTAASTLLCTELHARFTFGTGRRAGWREHWQSAGSATVAYLATTAAVYVLHLIQGAPGVLTEQIVYLSASGLAGLGRFAVLRLYVFAARRGHEAAVRPLVRQRQGAGPVATAA